MTDVNSGNNTLRFKKDGYNGILNADEIKGGIRRGAIKDAESQLIFEAFESLSAERSKKNKNFMGAEFTHDGVLDVEEIKAIVTGIIAQSKDGKLGNREANAIIKMLGLKGKVKPEDLAQFLEEIGALSAEIKSSIVETNEQGQKTITTEFNDGSTDVLNADGTTTLTYTKDGNQYVDTKSKELNLTRRVVTYKNGSNLVVTYEQTASGLTVQAQSVYTESDKTTTTEYNDGIEAKTTIEESNKSTIIIHNQDGKPATATVTEDNGVVSEYVYSGETPVITKKSEPLETQTNGVQDTRVTEYTYNVINENEFEQVRTITDPDGTTQEVWQNGKTLLRSKEIKGTVTTQTVYDYKNGTYTQTVTDSKNPGNSTVTVYNIATEKPTEQVKIVGDTKYYAKYDKNGNTEFAGTINDSGEIQGNRFVVQFLESPAQFAKRMGVSLEELRLANPGKRIVPGTELVIPGAVDADVALSKTKDQEPASVVQQRVQTNNMLKQKCRLANNAGYGTRVGNYTIQGNREGNRGFKVALDKNGNVVVLDKNNRVVPNDRVGYLDWWDSQSKITNANGETVVAVSRKDGHGRYIYYTENAELNEQGQPVPDGVMSGNWGEDNKYIPLADWYVNASDVRDICIKEYPECFSSSPTNDDVKYFTDPTTGQTYMFENGGAGRMLLGKDFDSRLNADIDAVVAPIIQQGKDWGTDENAMYTAAAACSNPLIFNGAEQKLHENGYTRTADRNAFEIAAASELDTSETAKFLTKLVPGAPVHQAVLMDVHFQDWTFDGGVMTTDADYQDMLKIGAAGGREHRIAVEEYYAGQGGELHTNGRGSYLRSRALDDGFSNAEISTAMVESGYVKRCYNLPVTAQDGTALFEDDWIEIQAMQVDLHNASRTNTEAKNAEFKLAGQWGENSVAFEHFQILAAQTVKELGLTADYANQDAGQIYAVYCARDFDSTNWDLNPERLEFLDSNLYINGIPNKYKANIIAYKVKQDPHNLMYAVIEPNSEIRDELASNLQADGTCSSIADAYSKCMASDDYSAFEKSAMKAGVMINGEVEFSEQEKIAFLKEFTHTITNEYKGNYSTLLNGEHVNNGDFALIQFGKLVSTLNPEQRKELVQYINEHDYTWITNAGGSGSEACYIDHDKKGALLDVINTTNYISSESALSEAEIAAGLEQFEQQAEGLAILENQFRQVTGAEGGVSDFANGCAEITGIGTDRQDVLNKLYEAGFRMDELKAAYEGKLYDATGKRITPEAYLEKYDVKVEVAEKIEDYQFSQACWKNAPVIVTVAGVTIVVGVVTEVVSGGTATPVVMMGVGAVASGMTQYLMDYYEMSSSGQGTTAHGRAEAATNALVTGSTAGFGMGVGKYVTKFGNFFTRASITVATDGTFASTVTSAVHDFDVKSVGLTLLMSYVFGGFGGPKGNKVKVGDIDVTTSVKPRQGSELFKHFDDLGNCGGKLSAENVRLVKEDLALRLKNGMIEPDEVVVWYSAIEALEHSKGNRELARELRAMLGDGTGVYLHKGQLIDICNADDAALAAFRKDVAGWGDVARRDAVLSNIDAVQAMRSGDVPLPIKPDGNVPEIEPAIRLVTDEPASTPHINGTSQRMFEDAFNNSQLKSTTSQNSIGGRIGGSKFQELKAEFEQLSALAKTPEQLQQLENLAAKFNPQHRDAFMEIINARRAKLAIENPNELYLNDHHIVLDRTPDNGNVIDFNGSRVVVEEPVVRPAGDGTPSVKPTEEPEVRPVAVNDPEASYVLEYDAPGWSHDGVYAQRGKESLGKLLDGEEVAIPETNNITAKLNEDGSMTIKLRDDSGVPAKDSNSMIIVYKDGHAIRYKGNADVVVKPGESVYFYKDSQGHLAQSFELPMSSRKAITNGVDDAARLADDVVDDAARVADDVADGADDGVRLADDVADDIDVQSARQAVDDIDNSINKEPQLKNLWDTCKKNVNKFLDYAGELNDTVKVWYNNAIKDLDTLIHGAKGEIRGRFQTLRTDLKAKYDALLYKKVSEPANLYLTNKSFDDIFENSRFARTTSGKEGSTVGRLGESAFTLISKEVDDLCASATTVEQLQLLRKRIGMLRSEPQRNELLAKVAVLDVKLKFKAAKTVTEIDSLINELTLLPQTNNTKLLLAEMQVKRQQIFAKPADIEPSPEAIRAAQGKASNMLTASDEEIDNFYNTLSPAERAIVDKHNIDHDNVFAIHGILKRKLTEYDTPNVIEARYTSIINGKLGAVIDENGKVHVAMKNLPMDVQARILAQTEPIEHMKMSCANADKKLVIITGRAGGGKSTIARQLGLNDGYYFPDADDLKAFFPGYEKYGAGYVHDLSVNLNSTFIDDAFSRGLNTVVQTTGWHGYIDQIVTLAKEAGYTDIQLVHVDVTPKNSITRSVSRGVDSGRTVDPASILGSSWYIDKVVEHCTKYQRGNIPKIIRFNNDGSQPVPVEQISFIRQ